MSDNHPPPSGRHEFNIAILCALPLEASVLQGLFDAQWDAEKYGKEKGDTNAYSLGVLGLHNVVLVHMPNMGKVAAAVAAANLRASFRSIQLALVVGICGGAPFGPSGEVLLGDVVISEGLVQYDLGRRLPNTFVRKDTPGENLPRPGPEVRATLAKLQTGQGRDQLQDKMLEHLRLLRQRSSLTISYPGSINDRLFTSDYLHRHRPPSECAICSNVDGDNICCSAMEATCEELGCEELDPRPRSRLSQTSNETQPTIHFGFVATGDTVMRSGEDRDSIAVRDKVIAFEMEGAGVWETFPAVLVIKGVCDYADSHKNKTWQAYAAATAGAAAKAFLKHWRSLHEYSQDVSIEHLKTRPFETRELEIMKRLNTSPYRDRKERNPDRVAGTCEWFNQHHLFQSWKQSVSSRLLWVSADPGCGKSVLVKYLVDSILLTTTNTTVCYFFFKDDFEDQKSITSALRCIIYQLFLQNPTLLTGTIINAIEAGGERFFASFSDLWYIFLVASQDVHAGEIICILDAIDECEDHGRSQLAKELCKLYGPESRLNLKLKFLVTSRPFGYIRQGFQQLQIPGMPTIHLSGESDEEMDKISAEIDIYIRARVEEIGERLKLNHNERHTLLEQLMQVPNRTYLWVYLILDLIENDINIDRTGILQATAHIPKTVDEAYDKILSKSYDPKEAIRILHIVVAAERALSLGELGFALSIRSHHQSYDDVEIKNEARLRENIRDTCGLFVTIIHSRVYLLHQTAKEFLVSNTKLPSTNNINSGLKWKHILSPYESHEILAEICIFYLLLSGSDTASIEEDHELQSIDSLILFDYSANYWATHLRESHAKISKPMRQSISRLCDVNSELCKNWLEAFWKKKSNTTSPAHFTALMVVSYFGLDTMVKMMLSTRASGLDINAGDWTYHRSALSWAAGNGFDDVVKLFARYNRGWRRKLSSLLPDYTFLINSVDSSGRTPLFHAIWNGNVDVVKTLLKARARLDVTDRIGGTPLFYAAFYRREAIVKLLLKHGATPLSGDKTAELFFSAIEKDDAQVVQLFIDSGFDIESRGRHNRSPLLLAMELGHWNTVQVLLDSGADIESRGRDGQSPLLLAMELGRWNTAQVLLDLGADIEAKDKFGRTPLHYAAVSGDIDIVQLLLNNDADIDSADLCKRTPIFYAIYPKDIQNVKWLYLRDAGMDTSHFHQHTTLFYNVNPMSMELVHLLLDRGADINAVDLHEDTPLIRALQSTRFIQLIRLLVDRGADVNSADSDKRTPLFYAIGSEINPEHVELLLDRGANINSADSNGHTPLFRAIQEKNLHAVHLLIKRGADINSVDSDKRTPLFHAIKSTFGYNVRSLLDGGADINAVDSDKCTPLLYAIQLAMRASAARAEMAERVRREERRELNPKALIFESEAKYSGIIRLLIDRGADSHLLNEDERNFLSSIQRLPNKRRLDLGRRA